MSADGTTKYEQGDQTDMLETILRHANPLNDDRIMRERTYQTEPSRYPAATIARRAAEPAVRGALYGGAIGAIVGAAIGTDPGRAALEGAGIGAAIDFMQYGYHLAIHLLFESIRKGRHPYLRPHGREEPVGTDPNERQG